MVTAASWSLGLIALGALSGPGLALDGGPKIHAPSGDSSQPVQVPASEVKFLPVEDTAGIYSANIVGAPSEPGVYVVLVRMDKGSENAPHTHPDGRVGFGPSESPPVKD